MGKELKNTVKFINSTTSNSSGFTTPLHYFEKIEDAIFSKIYEENLPKEEGLIVPENYFETLENKILKEVKSPNKQQIKTISFYRKVKKLTPIMVAASILLFIGFYFFSNNIPQKINLNNIADTEIIAWFNNVYETIDSSNYGILLENHTTNEINFTISSISNNDIENYFNSIEITPLLNEF